MYFVLVRRSNNNILDVLSTFLLFMILLLISAFDKLFLYHPPAICLRSISSNKNDTALEIIIQRHFVDHICNMHISNV